MKEYEQGREPGWDKYSFLAKLYSTVADKELARAKSSGMGYCEPKEKKRKMKGLKVNYPTEQSEVEVKLLPRIAYNTHPPIYEDVMRLLNEGIRNKVRMTKEGWNAYDNILQRNW